MEEVTEKHLHHYTEEKQMTIEKQQKAPGENRKEEYLIYRMDSCH